MGKTAKIMFWALVLVVACISTTFAAQQRVDKIGTTIKKLNVHANPSSESPLIGNLPKGVEVRLLDIDDEWYQIRYENKNGYVYGGYVENPRIETNAVVLGSFTTEYGPYEFARNYNIRKAAKNFEGLVVKPGQIISFNDLNGEASLINGYREAPTQVNGKIVMGEGGGICQLTTTLYNAVVQAGLEVLERHEHEVPVRYVNAGQDATVAFGFLDFVFKNSLDYAVKIVTLAGYDTITVEIIKAE